MDATAHKLLASLNGEEPGTRVIFIGRTAANGTIIRLRNRTASLSDLVDKLRRVAPFATVSASVSALDGEVLAEVLVPSAFCEMEMARDEAKRHVGVRLLSHLTMFFLLASIGVAVAFFCGHQQS